MVIRFFKRRSWDIRRVAPPWGNRQSISRYLVARLERESTSLSRADVRLPDEEVVAERSGTSLKWVAGALDGVFGASAAGRDAEEVASRVYEALTALTSEDSDEHARSFYSALTEHSTAGYIDALLPMIAAGPHLHPERVPAVARWLALEAADREPVKAAIAILGVVSMGEDRELFLTLGKHEEFTLFAAVALLHSEELPEPLLWELGRFVTGWGRVHIVDRLAGTEDARIQSWLLREGCRNDIMNEYSALVCATSGQLVAALRAEDPDRGLIKGAGTILTALLRGEGGPAEGIEAYADGPEAIELYLSHLSDREADLEDLNVVGLIERCVAERESATDDEAAPWRKRAAAIHDRVRAIRARPDWRQKIASGLSDPDPVRLSEAAQAAELFGIDTWDVYFQRLERGEDQWFFVMRTDDPTRVDRVVSLAVQRLPLDAIATGPRDELGIGPGFESHRALDFILQDLGRFPGKGWPLIRAGLQSPVTRNRNMAVRALAAWQRPDWPAGADQIIDQALNAEPNEDTREALRALLDGTPLRF